MKRHKKRKRAPSEVQLNLAAMLDMAFQLLTFFILTFRPSPVEGDIVLRMPPPMPTTIVKGGEKLGSNEQHTNPVQGLSTLLITLEGNRTGAITRMTVGDPTSAACNGLAGLDARLREVLGDNTAFEQVTIQVGSSVHYSELMQVIDVCTRQTVVNQETLKKEKLKKLNMVELPEG